MPSSLAPRRFAAVDPARGRQDGAPHRQDIVAITPDSPARRPESPADATKVTPDGPPASLYGESWRSRARFREARAIETTETPGRWRPWRSLWSGRDGVGLDQHDVRSRGDDMCRFDVERLLDRPAIARAAGSFRVIGTAVLVQLEETERIGETELEVEFVQVAGEEVEAVLLTGAGSS